MESFPFNVEKLKKKKKKNLSLSKIKIGAWAASTKGTEWLTVVQLDGKHGCGQEIVFSLLGPNCVE